MHNGGCIRIETSCRTLETKVKIKITTNTGIRMKNCSIKVNYQVFINKKVSIRSNKYI